LPTPTLANAVLYALEDRGSRGLSRGQLIRHLVSAGYAKSDPTLHALEDQVDEQLTTLVHQQKIYRNPGNIYTFYKNKFEVPFQKAV